MMVRAALMTVLLAVPAAAAETVTISTADCRRLVDHAGSADYRPGVDVRGRPVAPADLPGGQTIDLPEVIEIPLTVDVARRLGRGLEGKAPLGALTVKGNDLFWNGRRLQSQDEVLMAEACRSSLRARGIVLPEPKPE